MTTTHEESGSAAFSVLRAEERLIVGGEWVAVQRLAVQRRIVSQTVQLTVTVRREELVFEQVPLHATAIVTPIPYAAPLVILLREEIPVVTLETRPYEQVTVNVVQVAGEQQFSTTVDSEQIELVTGGS